MKKLYSNIRVVKLEGTIWVASISLKSNKVPFNAYWIEHKAEDGKYYTDYYINRGAIVPGYKLWVKPTNVIDEIKYHDYLINEVMDKKFSIFELK